MFGRVQHNRIIEFLNASDIFVLPTYHEGLPNVVLEAMACRLPVVATKVGGIPEAVKDGENGFLVPPKNVERLYRNIESLIKDSQLKNFWT